MNQQWWTGAWCKGRINRPRALLTGAIVLNKPFYLLSLSPPPPLQLSLFMHNKNSIVLIPWCHITTSTWSRRRAASIALCLFGLSWWLLLLCGKPNEFLIKCIYQEVKPQTLHRKFQSSYSSMYLLHMTWLLLVQFQFPPLRVSCQLSTCMKSKMLLRFLQMFKLLPNLLLFCLCTLCFKLQVSN